VAGLFDAEGGSRRKPDCARRTFGVAGQLQQRPIPEGGAIVKLDWFEHRRRDPGALMLLTAQNDPPGTDQFEEQEPGSSGKKVCHAHAKKLAGYSYHFGPSSGDKIQNFKPFAAQARVGNVKIVRGAWNKVYLDEVTTFPNGTYDDEVDGTSRAFNRLALPNRATVTTRKLTGW
jgi:predicted phage terminase large subunit-like protein